MERKRKPGFYLDIFRDADKITTITQTFDSGDGSAQSSSMRLMPLEANLLSLILNKHLVDYRKRSAYIGKERK